MHENRETSELPEAFLCDRPAGEGSSRTARVHAFEESDSGTVPMNHSNKSGQPPAESEEGRPLIKENTHQLSTHSTQSEVRVSQGLAGVRKAAKDRKEMKFTALLHHLTVALLRDSFYALKRKAAPGVDGVTWQEYETGLEGRLADLHSRVHRGSYRAQPSRRLWRSMLIHRGGKRNLTWVRMSKLAGRWIPSPRILHPYPRVRFDAIHPR